MTFAPRSAPPPAPPPPTAPPPRLAALRYRDFRLLWAGQLVSILGSQMQLTAINWHVFQLLKGQEFHLVLPLGGQDVRLGAEALGLGGLGLANVIPIVLFALVGGMVADSRDRRKVMLCTQSAMAVAAITLAAITLTGHATVPAIYLLSAATAAASAFNNPAQQSLIPNLVPREHLTNAISLNMVNWQLGTVSGPALAGIIVALFEARSPLLARLPAGLSGPDVGLALVYLVNGFSFIAVVLALLAMAYRSQARTEPSGVGLRPLMEGLRFVRGTPIIWSTMLLDFFATLFASARYVLPIVADQILHVGVRGYGLLATAQPAGAILAGAVMALRRDIHRQGRVLLVSVAIYGLATALFGLSTVLAFSYLFFALTGAADTVSTVIRATTRQLLTPDHLRGRMVGVNMMFFMGGPQLGELLTGVVASALGVAFAIVSGGVATVLLTGWMAWRFPLLRRYRGESVRAD